MEIDRLQINSAIQNLIDNPFDTESAMIIIQFGKSLPRENPVLVIKTHSHKSNGMTDLSAHTPEHGNVTVQSGSEEEKEFTFGVRFERVGHYRIWKNKNGLICFQYFWKAGLTTQAMSQKPPLYGLFYDPATLDYIDLAEEVDVPKFILGSSTFGITNWSSLRTGKERFRHFFQHIVRLS